MDRLTMKAFEKLQKREHRLQVLRDQFGLGRITRTVFREQEQKVIEQFQLTDDEWRAYNQYNKVLDQRKRK